MAVVRVHKTKDYTVMSNYHFREKEMTLKAKGLLSLMLSLPDNWDYSVAGLVAICVEKESAIVAALKELKRFGYLYIEKRMPNETDSGRIEYTYHIYEKPQNVKNNVEIVESSRQEVEKQGIKKQGVENQGVENQGQSITDNQLLNNQINNNKKNKKERKAKHNSFDLLIENYVETVEKEKADTVRGLLQDWLKNRKAKRAPMTDRSIELNLKVLDECAYESNMTIDEYLEAVIRRGWQAFYPINNGNGQQQVMHQSRGNSGGNVFLDMAKDEGLI